VKISRRGLYALKALLYLAETYAVGLAKSHEIAEREEIPVKFLECILVLLKNAGFVASERGRDGGYSLCRPPDQIVLGEVVRAIEGPLCPCEEPRTAGVASLQPHQAGLFDLFQNMYSILDRTTLADIVSKHGSLGDYGARGPKVSAPHAHGHRAGPKPVDRDSRRGGPGRARCRHGHSGGRHGPRGSK